MNEIAAHEIAAGDRLAITLKNGSRVAGTAAARAQFTKRTSWLTVRRLEGGTTRLELADIASIVRF